MDGHESSLEHRKTAERLVEHTKNADNDLLHSVEIATELLIMLCWGTPEGEWTGRLDRIVADGTTYYVHRLL